MPAGRVRRRKDCSRSWSPHHFVRDDVVKPNLGDNTERFLPYMLTLFFFIWFANMLGLIP